jgi:hypothetical protein
LVQKGTSWVISFYLPTDEPVFQELKKMNKKLLLGILCIAVIGIAATSAFADTWLSKYKNIYLKTGSSQGICLFDDCNALCPATDVVQAVQQGGSYEFAVYVLNTGTAPVYITYLPTDVSTDGGQTRFHIDVQVIGFGMPCEMIANNIPLPAPVTSLPWALPEKNVNAPTAGFPLNPNKMIKLDITISVASVDLNGQPMMGWKVPFEVVSVAV